MPRVSASATRRPITPIPTIPIFSMFSSRLPPRDRGGDDSSGRRGRTRDRARISAEDDSNAPAPGAARTALPRVRLGRPRRPGRDPLSPSLFRARRSRGRRAPGLVHGLRARGSVRPVGRLGARPHGGVARALRAGLRSGQARRALRGLPLPVQPPARSGRLLPRHPAGPYPARLARRRVPLRLLARRPARGRGPGALRGLLPDPGSLRGLSAQPALVRVPSLVPAAVHRRRVQADAALPALDGASGGAGLRALDRHPAVRAPHSGRHPHREHGPLAGSHPAAQPELEDDGGDHERTAAARSGRSGEVRLLALPHPDVRPVPRPPRRDRVRPVPAAAGVPPLARATAEGARGGGGAVSERVFAVGRDIAGLEQLLKSPKIRGGVGETLLENLLAQMLPREQYALQHAFATGDRVDAAIRIGERIVPIDAKFPLENFRRVLEETDEDKRGPLRRAFLRDVKNRVDEIAKKYILPDEGTFDFALMYIPAENIYYEIIVRDDSEEDSPAAYALARRVVPVSPNTFYAYLRVIVLGLRGLRIERDAQEIQARLGRLRGDLDKFREAFDVVGRHLTNARNKYDDAASGLGRLEGKLEGIERHGQQGG